jgi:subtilisin family serine protease
MYNDPLYDAQKWVYSMINVEAAWKRGFTGEGVHIRINDDGVDVTNKEFDGRFDADKSCTDYAPDPADLDGHGTSVASIAVGNAGNDHCAAGIAPTATFSACNVKKGDLMSPTVLAEKVEVIDVSQNSFGIEYVN